MSILKYMPGSAQTRGGLRPHAPRRPLKRAALNLINKEIKDHERMHP